MQRCRFPIWKILTARTLNSDVLQAFCSPIMVMSISVALQRNDSQPPSGIISGRRVAAFGAEVGGNGQISKAHQASWAGHVQAQGKKADAPEQAKEPVIDTAEDARHGGYTGDDRGLES